MDTEDRTLILYSQIYALLGHSCLSMGEAMHWMIKDWWKS